MADGKLTLVIEADAKGAITSIKQVTESQKGLQEANQKTSTSFTELNQALELAQKAYQAIESAARFALDAMDRGDAVIGVTAGFDNLSKSAGVLSETFRNDLSEAATGLVTDFDLMRLANAAMIKGIDPKSFVQLTDAAVNLGESLNVEATQAIETATNALGNMTAKGLMALGVSKDLVIGIQAQVDATNESAKAEKFRTLALEALTKTSDKFGRSQRTAGDAITTLKNSLTNVYDNFAKGISGSKELAEAIDEIAKRINANKSIFETFGERLGNGIGIALKAATNAVDELDEAMDEWANDSLRSLSDRLNGFSEGLGDLYYQLQTTETFITAMNDAGDSADDQFKQLSDTLQQFGLNLQESGVQGRLLEQVLDSLGRVAAKAQDQLAATKPVNLDVNGPGSTGGMWEWIENSFGQMLSGAGKGIGSGAEAAGGWAVIAKSVSDALQNAIVVGMESGTKDGFEAFGGSLGGQLGPLGQVFGENVFGQIYEGIEHVFGIGGSNDAAHKARNSINQFFHDVLEDNTINVVFDGILQRLEEIPFDESALRAGGWGDALNSASVQVQDGFNGIGLALQENLGISEDIAGQIAAALHDGVGGSLNDLQLLIQATGLSLDDMKTSIVDAFKSGEITALDTITALRGVENVFQEGIPDGIGMTGEAFENLKKGGANSLDALGDLAVELQEKQMPGVTASLEDLRKELIAQGKPLEEVDALMSAFARNGVDSLDDLLTMTEELGVSIIADLQQSTTAFGESLSKTADDIKSLSENIEKLDGKSFDIYGKVHIEHVGDPLPSGMNLGESSG